MKEVAMIGKITVALVAALVLGSAGIASAQTQRFDGWSYQHLLYAQLALRQQSPRDELIKMQIVS
jgi:hypothetical protein